MSASTKPRGTNSGKPETALAQLKAVWLRLPEATQDYWREQFCSSRKQSDLRAEIAKKLSVKLPADSKLTYFRDWLDDQDARDKQAERMAENERRIKSEHPDWTLDQVREETLKQSYFEALATGDFKMGLKTVTADVKAKSVTLDQEKFKEGLRTKLETALASLAEHIKGNPQARAAFEAFEKTISETTR